MARRPIAAGNWKMNFGPRQAGDFARVMRDPLGAMAGAEVVLFPPLISIPAVREALGGTTIQLGAQNCSDQVGGAFTGEVAPGMIKELCNWVIAGHSERRALFGETDDMVRRKALAALGAGLRPIVCVGERLDQRLADLPPEQIDRVAGAYEPVWAIGTGRAATRQDAEDAVALIRALVAEMYGLPVAGAMRILYGGSVTAANIADFMLSPQIDGGLVGGASLKPEFVDIARAIAAARQA